MSFDQIPKNQHIAVFDSAPLRGSVVSPGGNGILQYIRIPLYVNGVPAGTERLRVKLHSSDRYDSPFGVSNWVYISDIPYLSQYWLGNVRFDFNRIPIDGDIAEIFTEIEIDGYTRTGDTFYIGAQLDYPDRIYNWPGDWGAPIRQEWYWLKQNAYS